MSWLQKFFTELERDKTLRSSDILKAFLTIPDGKQFNEKKKHKNLIFFIYSNY